MAIKRLTIELDDSPDTGQPTGIPESLRVTRPIELKERQLTGTPGLNESEETVSPGPGKSVPRAHGRTVSDLIAEFINDARAMATILMFVPFVVFAAKIQTVKDLLNPIALGILLNVVWFVVPLVQRLFRKKNDIYP